MTLTLMGQTIYIESLYYPGWWVGTSERHNGALFQLSEVSSANINLTITILSVTRPRYLIQPSPAEWR